jgi:hypothetical protein
MRRALVLTSESSGHSFRASLPAHVFEPIVDEEPCAPDFEPEVLAAMHAEAENKAKSWRLTRSDVRGVVSTYLATFLAVLVFIL